MDGHGRRGRVPRRALGGVTRYATSVPEPYDAVLLDLYDTIVWSEWFRMRDAIATRIGEGMEADRLQKAFERRVRHGGWDGSGACRETWPQSWTPRG